MNIVRTFYDEAETKPETIIYYNEKGKYHRTDGPAFQRWYKDGKMCHEGWYINGVEYSKEQYDEYIKGLTKEEVDMLSDLSQTFD